VWARSETYWDKPVYDEGHYVGICEFGYHMPSGGYLASNSLPFSPGYPLLLSAASKVTGVKPKRCRVFLSAALFVVACLGLWRLLGGFVESQRQKVWTMVLFATWPGSLYFLTAYSEALYLPRSQSPDDRAPSTRINPTGSYFRKREGNSAPNSWSG
jgi:hypothetical protein